VHRGDTLWSLVERHLGPHCTAAEIAAEWPRWHAANRSVIGPDPDLLLPGQRLRPPGVGEAAGDTGPDSHTAPQVDRAAPALNGDRS
jgi:hypothetical protein